MTADASGQVATNADPMVSGDTLGWSLANAAAVALRNAGWLVVDPSTEGRERIAGLLAALIEAIEITYEDDIDRLCAVAAIQAQEDWLTRRGQVRRGFNA